MSGQPPAGSGAGAPDDPQASARERRLRIVARTLGRHGLAQAYGHCSERIDAGQLLVCAPQPMGLIAPGEPGTQVPVDGPLPAGVLGEVRLHQQLYRRRPDVHAIVRCMPPALMVLGTAGLSPAPRHGPGAYLAGRIAHWDDPQLVRDDATAAAVAETMGAATALVLRGNGVVLAAPTLLEALVLCWYLEDAARLELAVRSAGLTTVSRVLDATACQRRAVTSGGLFERMARWLTAGDPEGELQPP